MKNLVDLGEGVKVGILIITLEQAEKMLERNTNNRSPKLGKMSEYAIDMKEGKWDFNGVPIIFGQSGRLLDGQNRLMAVVRSKTAIKSLVVTGVPEKTFTTIDTGASRSGRDVLTIIGVTPRKASIISALIKRIIMEKRGRRNTMWSTSGNASQGHLANYRSKVTNQEIIDYYKANKNILDHRYDFSINLYEKVIKILDFARFIYAYSILSEIHIFDAEIFFTKLATGLNLGEDDPIYVLREKLIDIKSKSTDIEKIPGWHYWALIVKAWNLYRKGEKAKLIYIRSREKDAQKPI
jgi:hypothetical protein